MKAPRGPTSSRARWLPALLVVWGLSAGYTLLHLDRGGVPYDEGALGHTAERVLAGELPHRDFSEPYTGGLTYWHALAFAVLGTNLLSPRIGLFLVFLAWIPALYYIASRFAGPLAAGSAVLLGVVWSVPNYPTPVSSWYSLFFATFGTAALLRFLEDGRRYWLVAAGVCGGLSVLVKITGLSYVAAAMLFLVYHEQCTTPAAGPAPRGPRVYRLVLGLGLVVFAASLFWLVFSWVSARVLVHFVLPGALLAGYLAWYEEQEPRPASGIRLAALGKLLLPFLAGVAVPLAAFVVPFAMEGAVGALWDGVVVAPARRLTAAVFLPPPLSLSMYATLPLVLLLARDPSSWSPGERLLVVATLVFGLVAGRSSIAGHQIAWFSVRTLIPVIVTAGVIVLVFPGLARHQRSERRQQVLLALVVAAMMGLLQFPYAAPSYTWYVAPVVVVAALAVLSLIGRSTGFAAAAACAFYLAFGGLVVNRSSIHYAGYRYQYDAQPAALALTRGRIRMRPWEKEIYERLVGLIQTHAAGDVIYATPDCPEVYFLAAKRNPTRHVYEFLDQAPSRAEDVLELLNREAVHVVVLNTSPDFSAEVSLEVRRALAAQFPDSAVVADFVVRWRS